MSSDVIVVGAGQAAAQLCLSLRAGGFRDRILMIGAERFPPYQRPPLSKRFLTERRPPDTLLLRPETLWRDQGVELVLDTEVVALDLQRRSLSTLDRQQRAKEIAYGTLVLATGTRARALAAPGAGLAGVFSLRSIDDVHRLRPALDAAGRIVIVGGGYIGLEVAAVMRQEGRDVMVLEAENRLLKRVTGTDMSAFFETLHRERGVDIRLGAGLAAITGEGAVSGVRLADETVIAADVVLLAIGSQANDDLGRGAGLPCRDGFLVDALARTPVPGIYAIGDCTRFPSGRFGRQVRLESVQNAIDQAKAAAGAILGTPRPYDPVPWFWSDQYEIKLQMAGLSDGYDGAEMVGDLATQRFSVEYRAEGKLIAVDAVNDARAHMTARRRIAEACASPEPTPG
ncbi:MAG TPA: FAD-dependent oxidoreductase [Xanthobacteraceae bacterium]|jgi:3-phenylpropionate/trans-cinnamate dioxygenase ferredoxin reductase subunit